MHTYEHKSILVINAHAYYLAQPPPPLMLFLLPPCSAVYMCINAYTYVYTYVHTCIPTHPRTCIHDTHTHYTKTCMLTYNTCTNTYLDTSIHTRVRLCVCVCVRMRLYVRVCVNMNSGPQWLQHPRRHDRTTRGPALPCGTTPSLNTALAGNGCSLQTQCADGQRSGHRKNWNWSEQASWRSEIGGGTDWCWKMSRSWGVSTDWPVGAQWQATCERSRG